MVLQWRNRHYREHTAVRISAVDDGNEYVSDGIGKVSTALRMQSLFFKVSGLTTIDFFSGTVSFALLYRVSEYSFEPGSWNRPAHWSMRSRCIMEMSLTYVFVLISNHVHRLVRYSFEDPDAETNVEIFEV